MSLSSPQERSEPVNSLKAGRFDTSELRLQHGALRQSATFEDRGVLNLAGDELLQFVYRMRQQWKPCTPPKGAKPFRSAFSFNDSDLDRASSGTDERTAMSWFSINSPTRPWLLNQRPWGRWTEDLYCISFCIYCEASNFMSSKLAMADFLTSCLFNDIIEDTGSPAMALQSFLTMALQKEYYSYLPAFNEITNISTKSSTSRLAPHSQTGYWSVMGLLLLHVFVCSSSVFLFITRTQYSYLGNSWMAFSQIAVSQEVQTVPSRSALKTDKDVKHESGDQKGIYHVAADEQSGVKLRQVEVASSKARRRLL